MVDVTVASFEEMEPIYDGLARRARASLGVTGWGMQVMTLPPNWDGYPNHRHDASVEDANQEEVYIPIEGSGILHADGEAFELRPGLMVRVGPEQLRRIVPGDEGIRFVALGRGAGHIRPFTVDGAGWAAARSARRHLSIEWRRPLQTMPCSSPRRPATSRPSCG